MKTIYIIKRETRSGEAVQINFYVTGSTGVVTTNKRLAAQFDDYDAAQGTIKRLLSQGDPIYTDNLVYSIEKYFINK